MDLLIAIKKCIVSVKAALICLVYAIIIAMARVNGDSSTNHIGMAEA